jgi:hypothetical protein
MHRKMLVLVLLGIFLVGGGVAFLCFQPEPDPPLRIREILPLVQMGMSETQVEEILGRQPDIVETAESRGWWFESKGWWLDRETKSRPSVCSWKTAGS